MGEDRRVEFDFALNQKVGIPALNTTGRVLAMSISGDGKTYQIRYWWEGDARTVWLYADEIDRI